MTNCVAMEIILAMRRKQKLQRNKSGVQAFFEAPYPEQKYNEEPGVVYTFILNDDLGN